MRTYLTMKKFITNEKNSNFNSTASWKFSIHVEEETQKGRSHGQQSILERSQCAIYYITTGANSKICKKGKQNMPTTCQNLACKICKQ